MAKELSESVLKVLHFIADNEGKSTPAQESAVGLLRDTPYYEEGDWLSVTGVIPNDEYYNWRYSLALLILASEDEL